MGKQVLSVTDKLAFRMQGEAAPEGSSRFLVEPTRIASASLTGWAATNLVSSELIVPTTRVPETGILRAERDGTVNEGEPFGKPVAPCNEASAYELQRLDEVGVEGKRALSALQSASDVPRCMETLGLGEGSSSILVLSGQVIPSTICSASSSVKTRNEFVRTLPWALTARDTRVIVSSSGASAITT